MQDCLILLCFLWLSSTLITTTASFSPVTASVFSTVPLVSVHADSLVNQCTCGPVYS